MKIDDIKGKVKTRFRVSVGDDTDHEDLTAEIYFDEKFFAMITQEEGFDRLRIRFFSHPLEESWDIALGDVTEAIDKAKSRLWDLRKTP